MTAKYRHAEAGITLIEVLVVLAVIGVGAGATMMVVGDRVQSAETEAVRLARHLTLGVDEVLISGVPLVLNWDGTGYSFSQMPAGQPSVSPESLPAAPERILGLRHDLPDALELRLRDAASPEPVVLPVSATARTVTFDITGADALWSVTFDGFIASAEPGGSP